MNKFIKALVLWSAFSFLLFSFFSTGDFSLTTVLNQGTGIMSIFVLAATYTYNSYSKIFVFVNQSLLKLFNPTVHWAMQFEFNSSEFSDNTFKYIFDKVYSENENVQIISKTENELFLRINQINLELFVQSEENEYLYTVYFISDISYRDSIRNFYTVYEEYLNIIKTSVHKPTSEQFILKIKFSDYNPFYKIYLKPIDTPENISFSMKYNDDTNEYVVLKNEIQIMSNKLANIKAVSSRYVAISNKRLLK